MNNQKIAFAIVLVTFTAAAGAAQPAASAQPSSVLALFNRVPELPSTAEEAAKWVSKGGSVIHPGLLALKSDIEAHKRAMETVGQSGAAKAQEQNANTLQDMSKGMADVGIDMERAQRDPEYAKQVQERMKKMSPAEIMAMSQKMSRPMNQDKRLTNQAQAMVNDPPAVKAAAEAGNAYSGAQMTRLQAFQTHWQETEQSVQKIYSKPLVAPMKKPGIEWDSPGCDNSCQAQWDAYATKMLPLMVARDTEVLQVRRAALQRQRAGAVEGVKAADKNLLATQYGAASQSQVNKLYIVGYDGAAIGEIALLVDKTEEIVKSAAVVVHCGKQAVLAPGTVCN